MTSGMTTARTGPTLEAASVKSDVAALCLQLLVELSQRHAGMAKMVDSNIYLLRFLGSVPAAEEPKVDDPPESKKRPAAETLVEDAEEEEAEVAPSPKPVNKRKKKKKAAA